MKTRLTTLRISGLALALVMASISCGVAQDATRGPDSTNVHTFGGQSQMVAPAAAALNPIPLPKLAPGPSDIPSPQAQPVPVPAPPAHASAWTREIAKMAQAGIGDEIMLTYIDSAGTFNLSADEIVYLRDLGIPSQVIISMIQHDSDIVSGLVPLTMTAPPAADLPTPITIAAESTLSSTAVPQPSAMVPTPGDNGVVPTSVVAMTPGPTQIAAAAAPSSASSAAQAASPLQVQKLVYPVREPNPVELVPPITVVQMPPPERPLTTISIRFIP